MRRIAICVALTAALAWAQCDGCEGGGCEEVQAPACAQGEVLSFPIAGLKTDADRLALTRQLVRAQLPICDLDFEGNQLKIELAPEAELSLAELEASMGDGPFALDHASFVLPARTLLTVDGMSCMGCASGVEEILVAAEGIEVLRIDLGLAEIQVAGKVAPEKINALFAGSKFSVTGLGWGAAVVAAPAGGCCGELPGIVDQAPVPAPVVDARIANERSAAGEALCPVTGKPIADLATAPSVETASGVWYVCCKGCVSKLQTKLNND